eukprot:gene8053-9907_t
MSFVMDWLNVQGTLDVVEINNNQVEEEISNENNFSNILSLSNNSNSGLLELNSNSNNTEKEFDTNFSSKNNNLNNNSLDEFEEVSINNSKDFIINKNNKEIRNSDEIMLNSILNIDGGGEGEYSSFEDECDTPKDDEMIGKDEENNSPISSNISPSSSTSDFLEDIQLHTNKDGHQKSNSSNSSFLGKKIFSFSFLKTIGLVFLISNLGFGTFFSYTSPEALSHTIYDRFNIDSQQFGMIFTLYALPNICMVFISGMIVDLIGTSLVSIVLSTCVTLSALIGALSPPHFSVYLFSRFLLGFAGEALVACSNTMMSVWFSAKSVSTYIGFLVGWIYFANFCSLLVLPALNKEIGFRGCLWVIFFVASFGLTLNGIYLLFRNRFKDISDKEDQIEEIEIQERKPNKEKIKSENQSTDEVVEMVDLGDRELEITDSVSTDQDQQSFKNREMIITKIKQGFKSVLSIFIQIPLRMWIVFGIVFFGYIALYGIAIVGPDFMGMKYGYDEQKAALILSAETICSAIFSPLCGVLLKKFTRRIVLLWIALFLLGLGILLLITTDVFPLPWIIVSGIGYAILNTTLISSLPIFVPKTVLGTAYGLIGTSYNCGLVVFPSILGAFKESTGNYDVSLSILVGCCVIASVLVGWLKWIDLKSPIETRIDVPLGSETNKNVVPIKH